MPPTDHPDDRQAENPYRAPGKGQGIAQPQWRRPLSMALYLCASLSGLFALQMTHWGLGTVIIKPLPFPPLSSAVSFNPAFFFGTAISASVAVAMVWIARRISR